MRTVHDVASACGGGSEFAFASGFASRSDSDSVGGRGEHRPEVGGGEPV